MILLLLALAVAEEPVLGEVVPDPLADPAFAFCHEAGADADQVEAWCALLPELPPEACPGLRATCAAGDFRAEPPGCAPPAYTRDPGRFGGLPGEDEGAWRRREACAGEDLGCGADGLPDAQGGRRLLAWGAAFAVAVLLLFLVRAILSRLGLTRPQAAVPVPRAEVKAVALPGDDDLPLLPEEELLAEAERLLDRGRLGEAVAHARGAALRRLARQDRLVLHKARTDREYLRALAGAPEAQGLLATVLRAVEAHRFAHRALDPEAARDAVAAAARLLAAALLALLLLPSAAHAQRRLAPDGDAALYRLLEGAGFQVEAAGGRLDAIDDTIDLLVLDLTYVSVDDPTWEALRAWVKAGGLLLLAGDPRPRLDRLGTRGPFVGAEVEVGVVDWLAEAEVDPPVWPGGPSAQWCGGEGRVLVGVAPEATRLPEEWRAAGTTDCEVPRVVQALAVGEGWVIAVADARLLCNAALAVEANRSFLVRLLPEGAAAGLWTLPERPVTWLATASAGEAPHDPFAIAAQARLLPMLLHVLALWVLVALAKGWPLSPRRAADQEGRHDFVEHLDALARHWEGAGASRHAAATWVGWVLGTLGPDGLDAAARRAGYDAEGARALIRRAEACAGGPEGPDGPEDLLLVEELWTVVRQVSMRSPG